MYRVKDNVQKKDQQVGKINNLKKNTFRLHNFFLGCVNCAIGWIMDKEKGCLDVNECATIKPVCNPLQFCVNSEGSYRCLECDNSCLGCTGDGPDMCIACANGFTLIENVCVGINELIF